MVPFGSFPLGTLSRWDLVSALWGQRDYASFGQDALPRHGSLRKGRKVLLGCSLVPWLVRMLPAGFRSSPPSRFSDIQSCCNPSQATPVHITSMLGIPKLLHCIPKPMMMLFSAEAFESDQVMKQSSWMGLMAL